MSVLRCMQWESHLLVTLWISACPTVPAPFQADGGAAAPAVCRAPGEGAGETLRGHPRPAEPAALRPPEAALECRVDPGAGVRGPRDQRGDPCVGRHQTAPAPSARVSRSRVSLMSFT